MHASPIPSRHSWQQLVCDYYLPVGGQAESTQQIPPVHHRHWTTGQSERIALLDEKDHMNNWSATAFSLYSLTVV